MHVLTMYWIQERLENSQRDPSKHKQAQMKAKQGQQHQQAAAAALVNAIGAGMPTGFTRV